MGGSKGYVPVTLGEFIRDRLESVGWKQVDLAFVMGVTTAAVSQIINEQRSISPSMAKAIGAALKVEPEKLMHLQATSDLSGTEEPNPMVSERARLVSVYPLRDMLKRGWLKETESPGRYDGGGDEVL